MKHSVTKVFTVLCAVMLFISACQAGATAEVVNTTQPVEQKPFPTPLAPELTPLAIGTDGALLYQIEYEEDGIWVVLNNYITFEQWAPNLMTKVPTGIEYLPGQLVFEGNAVLFLLDEKEVKNLPEDYQIVVYLMEDKLMVSYHSNRRGAENCGVVDTATWLFALTGNQKAEIRYAGWSHVGGGAAGIDIKSNPTENTPNPCEGLQGETTLFPVK